MFFASAVTSRSGVLTCSVCLLVMLSGCSKEKVDKEPDVAVQTSAAKVTAIKRTLKSEAILFPLRQSAMTSKIGAPVREFLVNRGSQVRKGQLLAVLENRDLQASQVENQGSYQQAQAEFASATASTLPEEMHKAELDAQAAKQAFDAEQKLYASRETLFKEGALPRKELDQAGVALIQARNTYQLADKHLQALQAGVKQQRLKAVTGQLEAAKGKYLGAEAQLSYSEIRSPFDGVVVDRPLYPGEMAPAGTALLTVMDISEVIAKAHIPQQEASDLKVGDAATISAAGTEEPLIGKVTLISPALDPNSTTVEVWVKAGNKDKRFRPGSTVQLSIVTEHIKDAVVIPASALLSSPEGASSVMVVGGDGRAHQQTVEVGVRDEGVVQIIKGLKANEHVVIAGAYGLPDNTKVHEQSLSSSNESKDSSDKDSK